MKRITDRRLTGVNDVINQFVASMNHVSLDTKRDEARVRSFITTLRDHLSNVGTSLDNRSSDYKKDQLTDEQQLANRQVALKALEEIKQQRRNEHEDEMDSR